LQNSSALCLFSLLGILRSGTHVSSYSWGKYPSGKRLSPFTGRLLLFQHTCTHSRVLDVTIYSFLCFFLSGKRLSPFAGRLLLLSFLFLRNRTLPLSRARRRPPAYGYHGSYISTAFHIFSSGKRLSPFAGRLLLFPHSRLPGSVRDFFVSFFLSDNTPPYFGMPFLFIPAYPNLLFTLYHLLVFSLFFFNTKNTSWFLPYCLRSTPSFGSGYPPSRRVPSPAFFLPSSRGRNRFFLYAPYVSVLRAHEYELTWGPSSRNMPFVLLLFTPLQNSSALCLFSLLGILRSGTHVSSYSWGQYPSGKRLSPFAGRLLLFQHTVNGRVCWM
jgi:hypothetical protein